MLENQTFFWNDSNTAINKSCSKEVCRFNRSRIREETAPMSNPCDFCDVNCTYRAIECIFTVGIIANAIVLFRVARDRKLRNTTFVCIAACAAADMSFLIMDLALSYEAVILTMTCNYPSVLRQKVYMAVRLVARFSAYGHVTFLAVVRYVILIYPIKAKIYLSIQRVFLVSGLVWVLAALISLSTGVVALITGIRRRESQQFQLVIWTTVYLAPVTTTVTLHLVKIYKIGQLPTLTTNEQARLRVQAMSRMVLLVIFIATVLPFPFALDRLLQIFGNDIYGSSTISLHVGYIVRLFALLNHSINPVMYAFLSNPFRMSLKRMLGLNQTVSNGQSSNGDTLIATLDETQIRKKNLKKMTGYETQLPTGRSGNVK